MATSAMRDGMALPMVLLLLVATSAALIGAYNVETVERRVLDGEKAAARAMALAESGMEQFAARHRSAGFFQIGAAQFPDVTYDSARIALPGSGGYADVLVERIRPEVGNRAAMYLVRSRGVLPTGAWAGAPSTVRVVTRLAEWHTGRIEVHSAWTGISGLRKNGGSGSVSGQDNCGVEGAVAGVAVPETPGYSGPEAPVSGAPPIRHLGATPQDAADSVHIDWENIVNGTALTPDYVVPGTNWYDIDFSDWPVILVDNPGSTFDLPQQAGQRGTLIVSGDMEIDGTDLWDGIILIGGTLTSNGTNAVHGATVSGLNVKLGHTVDVSDIGNGTKEFIYDSCNVRRAMQAQGRMQILRNTWFDSWSMY